MRIKINFASRDYMLARKMYVVLLLAIAVSFLVFASNYQGYRRSVEKNARLTEHLRTQEKQDKDAGARLSEIKKKVRQEDVEAASGEAVFANAAVRRRAFSWTTFLNRLEDVVPDGVGIKSIKPDFETLDVDISGTALDKDLVTELVDRMTRSKYFEDIPPVWHMTEKEVDKDIGKKVWDFSLKIRYIPEGRAKEAAAKKEG
jgi:Tfp pilus assembly protein PilN